jgi:hypothetical protein
MCVTLDDSTGSIALRARTMRPLRWNVRFARDRISPGSTTRATTSGPALETTDRLTMPPSTTIRSSTCPHQNTAYGMSLGALQAASCHAAPPRCHAHDRSLPPTIIGSTNCSLEWAMNSLVCGSLLLHPSTLCRYGYGEPLDMVGSSADLDVVHKSVVADFEGDAVKRRWVPDRERVLVSHLRGQASARSAAGEACFPAVMTCHGSPDDYE